MNLPRWRATQYSIQYSIYWFNLYNMFENYFEYEETCVWCLGENVKPHKKKMSVYFNQVF